MKCAPKGPSFGLGLQLGSVGTVEPFKREGVAGDFQITLSVFEGDCGTFSSFFAFSFGLLCEWFCSLCLAFWSQRAVTSPEVICSWIEISKAVSRKVIIMKY